MPYFPPGYAPFGHAPFPFAPMPFGYAPMPFAAPPAPFHPGVVIQQQRRPVVALSTVVRAPESKIDWVPTVKADECDEEIMRLEREHGHDFSPENIAAERTQLGKLPTTIKRLKSELADAELRLPELTSLVPHWDHIDEVRTKKRQSTHSGKRRRLSPEERDEAAKKKKMEKAEADAFVVGDDVAD